MASKKQSGLGRGIEALFQSVNDETANAGDTVQELKLAEIRPNPYQPRKTFDEAALAELSASIKKSGVFQPIIVRQSQVTGYEIIAGERRFRASKLAGKTTIPAIVRPFDDEHMMEIAVLENLQREDLTPLEEAEAYNSLMEKLNLTQEQVSKRLGKSRPYIANYLRLLGLPQPVKELLQQKQLAMGQARTLLSLKDKRQVTPLAQRVVKEKLTVRQLEKLVAKLNGDHKAAPKKPTNPHAPYFRQCEKALASKFSAKVAIKANAKDKGKIEIDYNDVAEFNRLLELLGISVD